MARFFWVDLEMTGLDEKIHKIIEVAVVITDQNFEIKEQYEQVVFQPQSELDLMDEWCKKTHGASGLTEAIPRGKHLTEVEQEVLSIINRHYRKNDRVILCGNSVGNDQRFIIAHMPLLAKRLHYRIVDVSSFKEIFRSKWGIKFEKKNAHRAVDDILESIRELQSYLQLVHIESNDPS
ncbi:MAG: oligoribonuclease [Bdellovibrionaceae bacterium]|nr:oligoribonuclease [Pseudobdellovibrionaceae bacterium]